MEASMQSEGVAAFLETVGINHEKQTLNLLAH